MTSSEAVLCLDTGTPMKQSGTARRIIREPDRTYYIWIPVYLWNPEKLYIESGSTA